MRALIVAALILSSISGASARCCSAYRHEHRSTYWDHRSGHESRAWRYDGPVEDYGTRFYGENGGTVHYGY